MRPFSAKRCRCIAKSTRGITSDTEWEGRKRDDRSLLMEVFHRGGAKDDEESHPEGRPLKRNDFVGFTLFRVIVGLKNDRIQEEGQQAEHEEELDKEHRQVLGVMLDP